MSQQTDVLSPAEKEALSLFWDKVAIDGTILGCEAMFRLFSVYPATKTHFMHFNHSYNSPDLLLHGGKLMKAIGDGIKNIDNLPEVMAELARLHSKKLPLQPLHFTYLSKTIQITLATNYPDDFTPELQRAWEVFLSMLSNILLSKPSKPQESHR